MITTLVNLRSDAASITFRPPGGDSDLAGHVAVAQWCPLLADSVTVGAETVSSTAGRECCYLLDSGPVLGPIQRPNTVDSASVGIWTLVIVIIMLGTRMLKP